MDSYNHDLIIFSELIRDKMQTSKPPLIRHRRPIFRGYPDVFMGSEAVAWAAKCLNSDSTSDSKFSKTEDNCNTGEGSPTNLDSSISCMSESNALALFQRLMDAGLLRNVQTMGGFENDKALYRFSADDASADAYVRCVAAGYRLYKSALDPSSKLFQKVCAFGQLISCECIKASDMVSWFVNNNLCQTREAAVELGSSMWSHKVIKPVHGEVEAFLDSGSFYMFAVDFSRPALTVSRFLSSENRVMVAKVDAPRSSTPTRNRLIHLRQISDELLDFSFLSKFRSGTSPDNSRRTGVSTSSDDSGFNDNGASTSPSYPPYPSLLNSDGSMTKKALHHPAAPYVTKELKIYPDPVGYGFIVRGTGPCFVKIVDPDSPAFKAGLRASQYITSINGTDVLDKAHEDIENLILYGPKYLKITVMQHKDYSDPKPVKEQPREPNPPSSSRSRSSAPLPSAQPWIKKPQNTYRPRANYNQAVPQPVMSRT